MSNRRHWRGASVAKSILSEEWPPTTTSARGDRSALDAAWSYEQSPEGLPLAGLVAFEFDKLDGWLEEDDPVRGHPRDPYHRFDCHHTSEVIVVRVGGQVVAESRRAIKLFETSIPPRYYIPIADVTPGCLEPSTSPRTYCPYKGEAAYFNVYTGRTTCRTEPGPFPARSARRC